MRRGGRAEERTSQIGQFRAGQWGLWNAPGLIKTQLVARSFGVRTSAEETGSARLG